MSPPTGLFLVCVSNHAESETAVRYGCSLAKKHNGRVAILYVLEPDEFRGLLTITDAIHDEKEANAQELLKKMADICHLYYEDMPLLLLKEGKLAEEIVHAANQQSDTQMVILGIREESDRAPKLASRLADKLGSELLAPIMMIPGNISQEKLDRLI